MSYFCTMTINMGLYNEYFLESADNIKIAVCFYKPSDIPCKAILIIHGFGEHGGRFANVANFFVRRNYLAVTVDLRGNGRSEGNRGDAQKYDYLLEDIKIALNKINELFPGIVTVIYAHSFGCNIALNYCIRNCKGISSLVLASPWMYDQHKRRFLINSIIWLGAKLIPTLSFNTGVKGAHLSDNTELIEQYRNDPLKHKKITLRLFCQANKAGRQALDELSNLSIPVLFMFGSKDKLSSHSIISKTINSKTGKTHPITIKNWEGAYHELHSWLKNELVLNYAKDWIENSIKL